MNLITHGLTMPAIIFDTETTGIKDARIIEAAWIETDITPFGALLFGMPFTQRYNPGISSTLGALRVHNILDSELTECPDHSLFKLPESIQYVICQNSDFDMKLVPNHEKYKPICTVGMARKLWPEADSHSLTAMIYHIFGRTHETRESIKKAHNALHDCMLTWHLLEKIIEKAEIKSMEALYEFSEMCRLTTVRMKFGKYEGQYLADIANHDKSYLKWLHENPEMDEGLRVVAGKLLEKVV
jgi:exodeoxyribonuclease X